MKTNLYIFSIKSTLQLVTANVMARKIIAFTYHNYCDTYLIWKTL